MRIELAGVADGHGDDAQARHTGPVTRARQRFPVSIRSMNHPKPGWTLDAALDLLSQGYSAQHVERVSGYAARHLLAAHSERARS